MSTEKLAPSLENPNPRYWRDETMVIVFDDIVSMARADGTEKLMIVYKGAGRMQLFNLTLEQRRAVANAFEKWLTGR